MAQTIEIKGGTIIKLLSILIGMSLMIYFLNKYDRDEKSALLKENIELLQNSKSYNDIKEILQEQDTSIQEYELSQVAGINDNLKNKINEGNGGGYYYGRLQLSSLIFYANGNYYKYGTRFNNYGAQLRKFKKVVLPESIEEIINEIRGDNQDLYSILKERNKGKTRKTIILPIDSNKGEWYIEVSYYDKS